MAIAPYLDSPPLEGEGTGVEGPIKRECSADEVLISAILERSAADVGWLAWGDGKDAVVVGRPASSHLNPSAIGEFPDPPGESLLVDRGEGTGPWALWCRGRGILSCAITPITARGKVLGVVGLASCQAGALEAFDVERAQLISTLAVHARTYEARLTGMRRLFDEVSSTLESALTLDRALRLPPTYREVARSVGEALDATYCQIAVSDAKDALTIRGLGGHRPPRKRGTVAWPLADLPHCALALREKRGIVLKLSQYDPAFERERLALFSPTTKVGVILPFFAGPRSKGLLIIGEERRSRCQPMSAERITILELVASRIAHILRMSRRLQYEQLAERRRERRTTIERQRLAREVHDELGQALSALLVQVRYAMRQGHAGPEDLRLLEEAASSALDGARALAYGVRHRERGIGPLEHARSFSETLLRAAGCSLNWTEERADVKVASRTLREVGRVLKESVSNIVRHAQAKTVRIRVEYPDGLIRVTIHDDGVGFTPHEVRPAKDGHGLGLIGNAERLARIGGVFDVQSSRKGGTLVLLAAPRQ
jgi:signal transduction histidine kinase